MKMWVLIVMLHVNGGDNLTVHDFETQEDCLYALKVTQDNTTPYGGIGGAYIHGECKEVEAPRRYR